MERKFTVITPSILRPSLLDTCRSVDGQRYANWQHIVAADIPETELTPAQRELVESVKHPRRLVRFCEVSHRNFGNTCRHNAFKEAAGDFLLYMDDDDVYLGEAFETLNREIGDEVWGVFPVERFGQVFFNIPPGHSLTCSNQFFCKPLHPWPDNANYCADGEFIDFLRDSYPYQIINSQPLAQVRAIGSGR